MANLQNLITSHHLGGVVRITEEVAQMGGRELVRCLRGMVQRSGLTALAEVYTDLVPQGASCAILLSESHVALHSWPEFRCLTVDIHVCDFNKENLVLANTLSDEIQSGFGAETTVLRTYTQSVGEMDGELVDSSVG